MFIKHVPGPNDPFMKILNTFAKYFAIYIFLLWNARSLKLLVEWRALENLTMCSQQFSDFMQFIFLTDHVHQHFLSSVALVIYN